MDLHAPIGARAMEGAGARKGPGISAWLGLGMLTLLAFVGYLDRQIIALVVGPIEHDLRIGDSQVGSLQGAAFALGYLVSIPAGYAADRFSRPAVIFWSVVLWAAGAMLSGLAASFDSLFWARAAVGLGEAAVAPAVSSLLAEIFPRRRLATIFSIYGSGVILGSGGALWLGETVLASARGGIAAPFLGHLGAWQVAFLVTGLPAAALAGLVFFVPEPRRRRAGANLGANRDAASVHPPWSEVFAFMRRSWLYLVCYVAGQTCLMIVTVANLAWLPVIMQRSYGWGPAQLGSLLALFMVFFGFPGQMANGLIVDRLFARFDDAHMRYYAFAAVVITVCGVMAPLARSGLVYLAIFAPVKALLNFAGVFYAALQVVTPGRLRGRVSAVCGVVVNAVGTMIGPSMVALFTDQVFHDRAKVGWSLAMTTAITVPIAGLLFALALKPMREAVRREQDASPDPTR